MLRRIEQTKSNGFMFNKRLFYGEFNRPDSVEKPEEGTVLTLAQANWYLNNTRS